MATAKKKQEKGISAPGFQLQDSPPIFCTSLPGSWLLAHCTSSWRSRDREKGFQRIVRAQRAQQIASAVLDQKRTFPNAIILATDAAPFGTAGDGHLLIPEKSVFLVIDGQHRLWAQKHSTFDAPYACLIHARLQPEEMARLFIEINDTQRRVPSSLRWDLGRLMQPDTKAEELKARVADIVYELHTRSDSPFAERIDLTGEDSGLTIRQGSLAPEIHRILTRDSHRGASIEDYSDLLIRFFAAVQSVDPDGWGKPDASVLFKARVLRALLRVLGDILVSHKGELSDLTIRWLLQKLQKIDLKELSAEKLRTVQGSAGVEDLFKLLRSMILDPKP